MADIESFLARQPGFARFAPREREALARALVVQDYADGHVFIEQGRAGELVFLLVSGRVRVVRDDEVTGARRELKAMEPGELFGLLSLIDRMPAAATCIAEGPVQTGALPRAALDLLMHSAAPIAVHFQRLVAVQLVRDLRDRDRSLRQLLSGP